MSPAPVETVRPIQVPGRNCWVADAPVTSGGLLVDAKSYYRAFYETARQARRYILLAGWRFTSEVRLLRGEDARKASGDVRFLPFLHSLLDTNPELRIWVLAWDYTYNYALEWEWFQRQKFEEGTDGRLQFRFDSHHPTGGSHHQKLVVVDGQVAFVGGLDFSATSWDEREHPAHHPERVDLGQRYEPYHDVQAVVVGSAAEQLAGYFRERWHAATREKIDRPPPPPGRPPEVWPSVAVAGRRVGININQPHPCFEFRPGCQIRQLYLDAIASAQRLIYLENQYFCSADVLEALLERMKDRTRPRMEIVMVLPRRLHSWVEALAVSAAQLNALDRLAVCALRTGHRLGVYCSVAPDAGREVSVYIHSKLLLVDDRFLSVGSANTSNRSMGLDSELNVSWEVRGDEDWGLSRSIRHVRVNLLAEHCGLLSDPQARRELRRVEGLVSHLDQLAEGRQHRLRLLTREAMLEDRWWVGALAKVGFYYDPGGPPLRGTSFEGLTTMPSVLTRGVKRVGGWFRGLARGRRRETAPDRCP